VNSLTGLPNASYFPFDTLEAEVARPSRWDASPDEYHPDAEESSLVVVPKATKNSGGYPPLLSWVRRFMLDVLAPNVPYEPGPDVILSCGSTDGVFKLVDLLYDSWLPERGDPVSERPGLLTELFVFNNVLPVVEPHGIQIVTVEIDGEGILAKGPGSLEDVLRNWDPARGKRPHVLYTVT